VFSRNVIPDTKGAVRDNILQYNVNVGPSVYLRSAIIATKSRIEATRSGSTSERTTREVSFPKPLLPCSPKLGRDPKRANVTFSPDLSRRVIYRQQGFGLPHATTSWTSAHFPFSASHGMV